MNVSSVKALCTVSSAALAAGLAFVLWNYFQEQAKQVSAFDEEHATRVLREEPEEVAEVRQSLEYRDEVRPSWIQFDWTGAPEPEPVVERPKDPTPVKQSYTPVKNLLSIEMIQFDTDAPDASLVYVRYKGGGIADKDGVLKVGEGLPRPHQTVKVASIEPEGVEFSFADEGREPEFVREVPVAEGSLILVVGEGGEIRRTRRPIVQAGQVQIFRPEETTLVAPNRYRLGTKDLEYLNGNYTDVLTRDVSTKTHYENGRRAGIELTRVRKGSIAARHGAMEGDIIKSINGQPVSSTQEAINFAKNNQDQYSIWEIVVENMGRQRTITYESPSE